MINASTQLAANIAHLESAGCFDFFKPEDFNHPIEDIALIKAVDRFNFVIWVLGSAGPSRRLLIKAVDRFNFVMVGKHKQWNGIGYVEVEKLDVVQ